MTDTHVHLNIDPLFSDAAAHADAAAAEGVHTLIVPGFDRVSTERAVALAERDPRCHAIAGWHPGHCAQWDSDAAEMLRTVASHPKVVAIGEIGLDFYRGSSDAHEQESCFLDQLGIAAEFSLPVVLHCRPTEGTWDTMDRMIALLDASPHRYGVIWHCFNGTQAHADHIVANGGHLGFDGPLTYRRNDALRGIAASVPTECLLLETDAPYLSPEPYRGRFPNVPARLPAIAARLAEVRGVAVDALARATDDNVRRAFPRLAGGNPRLPAAI